jgi:biotin carboxylase
MRYLIVDPIGTYAERMKLFLDQLGLPAIAVFTNRERLLAWERKWQHRLGQLVESVYVLDDGEDVRDLARQIEAGSTDGGYYGIVPWDELHVLFAAELGEYLELGWNPRHVIERCRDKFVMKDWLRRRGGVRINASRVIRTAAEAAAFQAEVGTWPIVVKPTGGAGAMSVYFAHNLQELLRYGQNVLEFGMGEVLLEEFIGGQEYAVNGMVDRASNFLITDVWIYDKRESHGIPNLYYQSIKLNTWEEPFWDLARYAAQVVEGLELRRTPVHMEVKVDARGPCLIEIGSRMAGGDQPVLASKLHGHSLFELAACHYLDEIPLTRRDVDYTAYDSRQARIVSGIQAEEVPRVRAIHGVDEVEHLASFDGFGLIRPPGTRAPQTRDLNTKAYEVYLLHPDADQVERDENAIRRLLRYE